MDSRHVFTLLIVAVAVQRLAELARAKRNARALLGAGAVEFGARHYPVMVALHTAFLVAMPVEVFALDRPFRPVLAMAMLVPLVLAGALRLWTITTLGNRWTTRVFVVPGAAPVTKGPFRWLRHPNYLAVVVEIAALPLVHGAFVSAIAFSAANAGLLLHRIRVEERALAWATGAREHSSGDKISAQGDPA